ncbi:MAG: ferrochelatase [Acidobacteriota bacterium]|nr:ferrochelatase [Acidobacteriota bacterium]
MTATGNIDGERAGLLVMAYGTPDVPEQIEAYYTHIRRGRPPSDELLAELRGRYQAIGGRSPLREITRAQIAALRAALATAGREDVVLSLGFKHAAPFIEDGLGELLAAGVNRIVGLVLAPHYSRLSIGEYAERARAAAAAATQPATLTMVQDWHLAPGYLALLTRELRDSLASLPADRRERAHVLFTAHSLPVRILEQGDPYPEQLQETAAAVAELAGIERWGVAWQSAGRTAEPWIGPDVLEVLAGLRQQTDAVVVCPAGFVADHLEILYDLDVEARQRADELGLALVRTASPNDAPELAQALARVVLDRLAEHSP